MISRRELIDALNADLTATRAGGRVTVETSRGASFEIARVEVSMSGDVRIILDAAHLAREHRP
jgi:uncharacterized protein YhaN